jgi:hypothetical protein
MSKLLLKDRINKLLTGSNGPERIFYYSGSYKLLKAGKPSEIATDEAVRLMREGSGLVHIVEDARVWTASWMRSPGRCRHTPHCRRCHRHVGNEHNLPLPC